MMNNLIYLMNERFDVLGADWGGGSQAWIRLLPDDRLNKNATFQHRRGEIQVSPGREETQFKTAFIPPANR
jgi:hypothetical protein